jgi:hypothetical protein
MEVANRKRRRVIGRGPSFKDLPPRLLTVDQRDSAFKRMASVSRPARFGGQRIPPETVSSNLTQVGGDKRFVGLAKSGIYELTWWFFQREFHLYHTSPFSADRRIQPRATPGQSVEIPRRSRRNEQGLQFRASRSQVFVRAREEG